MTRAHEEKRIGTVEVEERAGKPSGLTGYAAVFGQDAVIAGVFRERIDATAFNAAIGRDDVRALFNHDPNFVLGRSTVGTLRLSVDARGLRYEVDPPDTTWARDLQTSVKRGDVSQSSFAFRVTAEEWREPETPGQLPMRVIKDVELYDVSPVTYPAYDETSVAARDAAAAVIQARGSELATDYARWRVRIATRDQGAAA